MAEITLHAEAGRTTGTRPSGRLRSEGRIPGIVYGHGMSPLAVSVDGRELRTALTTDAGLNALLSLDVGGGTTHLAMAREIQRHPVRGTVTHVDFQIVRRDEIISAEVPVNLVGEAENVHRNDGLVDQQLYSLTVHATPGRIPSSIDVDISGLQIGDAIRVGDLPLPEGVTTDLDPEETIVVAQGSALAAEADALEAEAEEAAGEGAEGGATAEAGGADEGAGGSSEGDG